MLLLSLILIVLEADFTGLWLHLHSLSSLLFSRQAPSSFFFAPITIFAILMRRDNETTSATTALRTITYVSVTTFCKQDILYAFLSGADVCTQATRLIAFVKRDKLHS